MDRRRYEDKDFSMGAFRETVEAECPKCGEPIRIVRTKDGWRLGMAVPNPERKP